MKKTMKACLGALAVAASAAALFFAVPLGTDQPAAPASLSTTRTAPTDGNPQAQSAPVNAWFDAAPTGAPQTAVSPLSTMSPPQFAADSGGKLVLNADTHANIEKLLLEEDPAMMRANLDKASRTLPPQAQAELQVLVGKFQQYSKALPHTIPPDNAPETEQERLKLLDSLHQLRVSYLGADAAQAMFGEEEATSRKLIGLMATQNDPNLTSQQKAERAQELLDKAPAPKPPPAG